LTQLNVLIDPHSEYLSVITISWHRQPFSREKCNILSVQ